MTNHRLRVLLVAEESAGLQTLKMLSESDHELVGVLASENHNSKAAHVWDAAAKLGVPTWPAMLVRDESFADRIREWNVDLLLNVHSLYLIRPAILEACRIGAFNMHPGPLPHYAGLNVSSWAIYNGESEHAVTVHQMVGDVDAGTIAFDAWFPIEERDNGFSLMAKCIRAGVPLIKQLLEAAEQGADAIPRKQQDLSRRRYFGKASPNAGQVEWDWSARDVFNHVRAADYSPFASPWGAPLTRSGDGSVGILKAELTGISNDGESPGTVGAVTDRGVLVACADEWLLIRKVTIDGIPTDPRTRLQEGAVLRAALAPAACC